MSTFLSVPSAVSWLELELDVEFAVEAADDSSPPAAPCVAIESCSGGTCHVASYNNICLSET
jgi:hypothetical protein